MYLRTGAAFAPNVPDPTRQARQEHADHRDRSPHRPLPALAGPLSRTARLRLARQQQPLRDLQHVHRPVRPRAAAARARGGERPAAQDHRAPLRRHRLPAVHGPEQRPRDRGVRVGVAAAPHRGHDALLEARRVQQLVERVLQRDPAPSPRALPSQTGAARRAPPRAPRARAARRRARRPTRRPRATRPPGRRPPGSRARPPPRRRRSRPRTTGFGCVRLRPAARARRRARGERVRVDAERARPHQRAVGLARGVRVVAQRRADRVADVERRRAQPVAVGLERRLALEAVPRHDRRARARAPSPSRRSAGRRAGPSGRRPRAGAGRPGSARAISAAVSNSTSAPRLSPATCPRRQPCARASRPASRTARPFTQPHRRRAVALAPGASSPACATAATSSGRDGLGGRRRRTPQRLSPSGVVARPPGPARRRAWRRPRAAARGRRRSPRPRAS